MNLGSLVSEARNPQTLDLDALSTLELVNRFNQQDTLVALAVKETLPEVAKAVDAAAAALKAGGRIIYMGAGTSGRLGVLDASECPPTFGVPHGLVVGLIAGGPGALLKAVEGAEDSKQLGEDDLKALNLTAQDLVVGLAASGRTPYVIGGLEYARQTGCTTVAISCNPGSPIAQVAAIAISPVVGPEALTGSTRLKSGTAQKLVLNMISTGAMVKFGKVYQNLMVDMKATNIKLVDRACRMVVEATGASREEAEAVLKQTDYDVKPAILMILSGLDAAAARAKLNVHHGYNALFPILAMAGVGQVGASIAVLMKTRNTRLKKVIKGALPVGLLGIGEPLIFGVTLPLGKPFLGACLGGAVGGALISYWKVATVITFGISGLPLALTIVTGKVMLYLAGFLVAVIAGFLFTWLLGFNDPEE